MSHAASVAKINININKILMAFNLSKLSLLSVASHSLKERENVNSSCFLLSRGIEGTSRAGGR